MPITVTENTKNHPLNRYVIFKNNNFFYEGRIVDVFVDNGKTLYSVISFTTFEYFRVTENELIIQTTLEALKKYKPSMTCDNFTGIRMPSLLKNRLRADKDYYSLNHQKYPTGILIPQILKDFILFFQQNCQIFEPNESQEVIDGFLELFNLFLPICLLYSNETISNKKDYSNDFGGIHLLRLLYFIQINNLKLESDCETLKIISDYTIYLIDFLNYKYDLYFD